MTNNDDDRPLKHFAASRTNNIHLGYIMPNMKANNFELKSALLNMFFQNIFNGLAHEDPKQHLTLFEELCNTIKINGVKSEAIKLRACSFSLGDRARN
jgi:hypothetical protein